jgi:outer membrane biosynthesis protein TonB
MPTPPTEPQAEPQAEPQIEPPVGDAPEAEASAPTGSGGPEQPQPKAPKKPEAEKTAKKAPTAPQTAPEPKGPPQPLIVFLTPLFAAGGVCVALGYVREQGEAQPDVGLILIRPEEHVSPLPWYASRGKNLPEAQICETLLTAVHLAVPPTTDRLVIVAQDAEGLVEDATRERADASARFPRAWGKRLSEQAAIVAEAQQGRVELPLDAKELALALWMAYGRDRERGPLRPLAVRRP